MKKIIIFFLWIPLLSGQSLDFQHGISLSLYFGNEFKYLVTYNPNISYPIKTFSDQAAIPMLDLKISMYNNNLGSSVLSGFRNKVHFNLAFSPVILYGCKEARPDNASFIPVFSNTFTGFTHSKYKYNIGFATSYISQSGFGKVDNYKVTQRLGNIIVSVDNFYFNYYNDGGPINKFFGDREDRYWTGGGVIGCKFVSEGAVHHLSLSFDKYTGFVKHAFEASGLLHTNKVLYPNPVETTYNSGKYSLRYWNPSLNFGAGINWWNTPFDFQDFLHRDVSSDPYHYKLQKKYVDFEIFGNYEN